MNQYQFGAMKDVGLYLTVLHNCTLIMMRGLINCFGDEESELMSNT